MSDTSHIGRAQANRTAAASSLEEGAGAEVRARLILGSLYTGTVISVDAGQKTHTVRLDAPSRVLSDVRLAAVPICALLGIRISGTLTAGTRVKVSYDRNSYIIAALPPDVPDLTAAGARKISTADDVNIGELLPGLGVGVSGQSDAIAVDQLDGEFSIGSSTSAALDFLMHMVRLRAGRATVETLLYNDMVRIVSCVFRHHSAIGDHEIFSDGGRVNATLRASARDFEVAGKTAEGTPLAEKAAEYMADPSKMEEDGRWRFQGYMGCLGDFIHLIVCDPEKAVGTLTQTATGKSRVWIGTDGTMLTQSVSEIAMEVVTAIPVPVRLAAYDSEAGNLTEEFASLDAEYLKLWDAFRRPEKTMKDMAFQLREYARWLSTFHSFSRFLQQNKDYRINVPGPDDQPEYTNGEADREKVNGVIKAPRRYSTLRLMRDGSNMWFDGYGASIVSNRGNIQVSTPVDLTFQAGGDIRLEAGGNIHALARKNLELASLTGWTILTSRAGLRMVADWGRIHLKSGYDRKNPKTRGDQKNPEVDPDPTQEHLEDANPDPDDAENVYDPGIIFETPSSGIAMTAQDRLQLETLKGGIDIKAASSLRVDGAKTLVAKFKETVRLQVSESIFIKTSRSVFFSVAKIFNVNDVFGLVRSKLLAPVIETMGLRSKGSIFGPKMGPTDSTGSVGNHLNHIQSNTDAAAPDLSALQDTGDPGNEKAKPANMKPLRVAKMKLLGTEEYWNNAEEHTPYETVTQNFIKGLEGDDAQLYFDWDPTDTHLSPKLVTGNNIPGWGSRRQQMVHTPELPNLQSDGTGEPAAEDFKGGANQTPMKKGRMQFKARK